MAEKKQLKEDRLTIRFEPGSLDTLEKEAQKEGLSVTSYVRHLIATHPKRQQKPAKK